MAIKITSEKTEFFIQNLQRTGLDREEALIYFTLIQHGKKGTYIKDLSDHLPIKRTTLYSILDRLNKRGCVRRNLEYSGPKGARIFAAISPELYIERIIKKKKIELQELEEVESNVKKKLEDTYLESMEFSIDEISSVLIPYLKPLYEKGWKVIEHIVEKSQITHRVEAYDITLLVPNAKFVKEAGFLLFKYNRDIENDENIQNYIFATLSRKSKEEVLDRGIGIVDIELNEKRIELNGRQYRGNLPKYRFEGNKDFIDITEIVMIPIKNKIFYIWAENHEIILKMTEAIFREEK